MAVCETNRHFLLWYHLVMLDNYLLYLGYITNKIQKYFEEQKEYICCSKGCSKCCQQAQFPYSEIEFKLIFEGLKSLEPAIQSQVLSKIDKLNEEKNIYSKTSKDSHFQYDCPFLINNECSVYYYRGLVCRSFGLISFIPDSPKTPRIPFCAYEGLNFSNVLDKEHNNISDEKYLSLNLKTEPKAYNIDYSFLTNKDIADGFGFEFGEVKPLIEWFTNIRKTFP